MPQFSAEMVYEENFLNGFIVLLMLKIDAFFNCYLCPEIRGIPPAKTGNPVKFRMYLDFIENISKTGNWKTTNVTKIRNIAPMFSFLV